MPKVGGKPFVCPCGCNVFTKGREHRYSCNACDEWYASDWLESQDVIRRLCKLQGEVMRGLDLSSAGDCFCGEDGYWGVGKYDGTFEGGYRNEGEALEFIERAVREALRAATG